MQVRLQGIVLGGITGLGTLLYWRRDALRNYETVSDQIATFQRFYEAKPPVRLGTPAGIPTGYDYSTHQADFDEKLNRKSAHYWNQNVRWLHGFFACATGPAFWKSVADKVQSAVSSSSVASPNAPTQPSATVAVAHVAPKEELQPASKEEAEDAAPADAAASEEEEISSADEEPSVAEESITTEDDDIE